jgi:iron complex transport system substrate-binding protein
MTTRARLSAALLFAALVVSAAPVHRAERIVSTAPSITETLFALGLGSKVVGVTDYCDYPPEAKARTRIGSYVTPNVETIAALHPDLVVVARIPNQLPQQLDRLGIRHVEVDSASLKDVFITDTAIANAAGVPEAARRLNHQLQQALSDIGEKTAPLPKLSAMFVIDHSAGQAQDIFVGGDDSYFTELLHIAGATNVFSSTSSQYPQVSKEEILRRDPDVILEMVGPDRIKKENVLKLWSSETSLRAVRSNHIFTVPADVFVVPGPRVVEAATLLAKLLHPELKL